MPYCLPFGYVERPDNDFFDDTCIAGDAWQKEVYETAARVAKAISAITVADVGCGNGYKLVHNFPSLFTIGYDLEPTVNWLRKQYPIRRWCVSDFVSAHVLPADLVICADAIEHVSDPDALLNFIKRMSPRRVVFSTPAREFLKNLQPEWKPLGPPVNPAHVREWTSSEFAEYVGKSFRITQHFMSNDKQGTQCLVCSSE